MKLKNTVLAGLSMGLALGALLPAHAQERGSRIVVVHLERLFNEYYKTKRADAQLRTQAEEFNKERQKLIAEAEAVQKEFTTLRDEAQNPALTEEARNPKREQAEAKLLAIREQETKIKSLEQLRSKQLDDQSRRMRRGLVGEIREAVQSYAKAQAYEMVVDLSGNSMNGVEMVLYADTRLDITNAVLEQINQGGMVDAGASSVPLENAEKK